MNTTAVHPQPPSGLRSCAIACLRSPYDGDAAKQARAELSAPNFDWPAFVRFLHTERIAPLVHFILRDWEIFPSFVEDSLKRAYLQSAWINELRMEEFGRILAALQAAGINSIALKGAAFVHTIYEKSALRPMCDIDLLVKPEDVEKTQHVLAGCGFTTLLKSPMPEAFENEMSLFKPLPEGWKVDLHCSLLGAPHNLSTDQMGWFWQHRILSAKNGREIGMLDVDAQMLHLCAHLWLHHGGGDLLGAYDIYRLIVENQCSIDWEKVLAVGKDFELLLPLQHVLPDMATQWKAPIPEDVIARLSRMVPSVREKRKFNKFLGDGQDYISTLTGSIMSYPDWKTGFRYAWAIAFPPAYYMEDKFQIKSRWKLPYYYAYRIGSRIVEQTVRKVRKAFQLQ